MMVVSVFRITSLYLFFTLIIVMAGNRFSLPNASIMLNQPKSRARGQASDVVIKARETVTNRRVTNEFLAKACGRCLMYFPTFHSR